MKKQYYYIILLGLIVLLAMIFIFRINNYEHKLLQKVKHGVSDKKKGDDIEAPTMKIEEPVVMKRPEGVDDGSWNRFLTVYEKIKSQIVPIDFYGKVIDQYGNPVANVKIECQVSSPNSSMVTLWEKGFGGVNRTKVELLTDSNGLFILKGYRGARLYIDEISKEGYEPTEKKGSFNYSGKGAKHKAFPEQPVVFKIWKKGEIEPLIKTKIKYMGKQDGRLYFVDIIKGKVSKTDVGEIDLRILTRVDNPDNKRKFDWNVLLTSVNGGILEATDDDSFMYEAPQSGYLDAIQYKMSAHDKEWLPIIEKRLYIKSRFGKVVSATEITIDFSKEGGNGESFVILKNIVNPNGSTNLQYDPSKRILDP